MSNVTKLLSPGSVDSTVQYFLDLRPRGRLLRGYPPASSLTVLLPQPRTRIRPRTCSSKGCRMSRNPSPECAWRPQALPGRPRAASVASCCMHTPCHVHWHETRQCRSPDHNVQRSNGDKHDTLRRPSQPPIPRRAGSAAAHSLPTERTPPEDEGVLRRVGATRDPEITRLASRAQQLRLRPPS